MTGVFVAAAVIAVPAFAFALWPLVARGRSSVLLALPPDAREHLVDRKRAALRALREIEFEHAAGHVSDDDYADLRARYEAQAAEILTALDRLKPPRSSARAVRQRDAIRAPRRSGWQHPAVLTVSGVFLVVLGIGIAFAIVRHTVPDQPRGGPARAARTPDGAGLRGMMDAAYEAMVAGRNSEALAAYQAILKRDPNNLEAISHVAILAAKAGEQDRALRLLDRALAIDPRFPPALLIRAQVFYRARDMRAAIPAFEKYLSVAPPGQDRETAQRLLAAARSTPPSSAR